MFYVFIAVINAFTRSFSSSSPAQRIGLAGGSGADVYYRLELGGPKSRLKRPAMGMESCRSHRHDLIMGSETLLHVKSCWLFD